MTAYIPWSQAGVGTLCHKWEGSIQSLSLQGFQVAYVVFQKPSGVSAALNLKGPLLVSTESHLVKSGIHKWISDYEDSVLDPEALRMEVDAFMEAYDKKIAEVGLQQDSRVSLVLCIVVCCL